MKKSYDLEFTGRPVRLVRQRRIDSRLLAAASMAMVIRWEFSRERLRNWVQQAEVGADHAPGVTTEEEQGSDPAAGG